jgi:hypothetical protein
MCLYFVNWINLQFLYILMKNQKADKKVSSLQKQAIISYPM